ncbi:uncharacterized protein [Amphiura filiformis]|uniref:uncharacterized protein n=1 Tax=Amphiura filiformis TaxID=82378 RepID=UPI003B2117E3
MLRIDFITTAMEVDSDKQEATDVCTAYHVELQKKAELLCQQRVVMSDIQMLTKDVHNLSEEVKKACLVKKWGNQTADNANQKKDLPEEQTYQLCREVMEDQDLVTDIVQDLQQQQSQLDSEVAKVMSKLKGYYAKS